MPTDVGGYQADEDTVAEVLAQIARGCPSTSWMCNIMLATNVVPALLTDEAANEIYATPDLRMTAAVAPTGEAVPVEGGYRVTGRRMWNTAGIHSNWFGASCVVRGEQVLGPRLLLLPSSEPAPSSACARATGCSSWGAISDHQGTLPGRRTCSQTRKLRW
jgi:alkylation response protein AidB-like acyl-CoA dehydrogenase